MCPKNQTGSQVLAGNVAIATGARKNAASGGRLMGRQRNPRFEDTRASRNSLGVER